MQHPCVDWAPPVRRHSSGSATLYHDGSMTLGHGSVVTIFLLSQAPAASKAIYHSAGGFSLAGTHPFVKQCAPRSICSTSWEARPLPSQLTAPCSNQEAIGILHDLLHTQSRPVSYTAATNFTPRTQRPPPAWRPLYTQRPAAKWGPSARSGSLPNGRPSNLARMLLLLLLLCC